MSQTEIPIKRDADKYYRYKMPQIQNKRLSSGNGVKTTILNAKAISSALGRSIESLIQWYNYSLGVQTKLVPKGNQIFLNGDHQQTVLLDKIYEFIDEFVLCPACSNPETTYVLKDNIIHLHCNSCGNTTAIKQKQQPYFSKMTNWLMSNLDSEKTTQKEVESENLPKKEDFDSNLVTIDVNELDAITKQIEEKENKEPSTEQQDEFFNKITKMANKQNSKDIEIFNEIQNFQKKWKVDSRWLMLVIFHALFENNQDKMLQIIKDRRDLLILCTQTENDQKLFLGVMTQFITKENPNLLTSAPIIFYTLYDCEVINDSGLKNWIQNPSKSLEGSKKVSDNLRNVVLKDFIKWVNEAEFEPKDECEKKDDDNDVADVVSNQNNEDEKDDDIDIDSI